MCVSAQASSGRMTAPLIAWVGPSATQLLAVWLARCPGCPSCPSFSCPVIPACPACHASQCPALEGVETQRFWVVFIALAFILGVVVGQRLGDGRSSADDGEFGGGPLRRGGGSHLAPALHTGGYGVLGD